MCNPIISRYKQFLNNYNNVLRKKGQKCKGNLGTTTMLGKPETHEGYAEDYQINNNNNNINNNNNSHEQTIRNIMNMDMLQKSSNLLKKLNTLISQESTNVDLEEGWFKFVQNLGIDMQRLKEQVEELERVLAARDRRHEIEVQKLFEEFETQLTDEKEKLSKEIDIKEKALRYEMREKLEAKEHHISEVISQRDEVIERLYDLQVKENGVKIQNVNLLKIKDEQQQELDHQQNTIHSLQQQLDKEKRNVETECKKHFEEGFLLAQQISVVEEEGLLQQMKIIKEMQMTLQSDTFKRKCSNLTENLPCKES